MTPRHLIFSVIVFTLGAGTADAAQKLTINYTTGESVTAFVAKEQGFFAKHGLEVDLVPVTQNSNAPAALEAGAVQGVTKFSVVVRSGLDVKTGKDLVGKKVGVPGIGASIDIFFRNWLLDNRVEPATLSIVETTFLAMADNLKSNNLDAVTPLEPFITRITSQKIGYELVNLVDRLPREKINALLFAAKRGWASENGPTIKALRTAVVEADDFIRANPEKSREAINKYTQVPLAILNALPLPAVDPELRKEDLEFWAGMMERLHMLQGKPDTAKLIWH
jgi:NitT/TauT family transport system substrate-binding protein